MRGFKVSPRVRNQVLLDIRSGFQAREVCIRNKVSPNFVYKLRNCENPENYNIHHHAPVRLSTHYIEKCLLPSLRSLRETFGGSYHKKNIPHSEIMVKREDVANVVPVISALEELLELRGEKRGQ